MSTRHHGPRISRRSFVVGGLRVTALGSAYPALGSLAFAGRSAADDRSKEGRILVVVQLSGGNDGLNTVIPYGQDAYYRLRPTLAQKPGAIHSLDEHVGLHPTLGGLKSLYDDGAMTIVHGIGHPNADRSHFRSLEIWHTAEPFEPVGRVGWLGHLADQILAKDPASLPALTIGGRGSALSMRGAVAVPPTVPDDRGFRLAYSSRQIARERAELTREDRPRAGAPQLEFLRAAARTAYDAARRMAELANEEHGQTGYPDTTLAKELRLVAQLIRGGFGTRIFHVGLGGFDTHASQASVHSAHLAHLDGALTAFQRDLMKSGKSDDVATLVFSEFGRRAQENGSRGTDHGRGNPLLLFGTKLRAGQHGERPDLGDLVDGDVRSTADFRGIYRQLERDWMGLEPFSKADVSAPRVV